MVSGLTTVIVTVVLWLCLLQWLLIKVSLYQKYHPAELETLQKISEKQKIKQNAYGVSFLPLFFLLIVSQAMSVAAIIVTFLLLLGGFLLLYVFINKLIK